MNERIIAVASLLLATSVFGCGPMGAARTAHDEHSEAAERAEHGEHGDDHDGDADDHLAHHPVPTDAATIAAAAKIRVLNDSSLSCASQVLGVVDVHEPVESDEAALDILRRRAAALGAEAITGVEFRHGNGHERTHMSGTAVRCKDLLNGRKYDVLEHIVIKAKMGGEDEAFDELKRRARDLGANLILEAKFRHGESASEGLVVSGTAVRAYDASERSSSR
jgi:uncharacterized protein YbjQ (UPF0145 family)